MHTTYFVESALCRVETENFLPEKLIVLVGLGDPFTQNLTAFRFGLDSLALGDKGLGLSATNNTRSKVEMQDSIRYNVN